MFIEHPTVEVIEVSIDPVLKQIVNLDGVPIRVDLGNEALSRNINSLLAAIRERPSKTFLLRWAGNRVPAGAVVLGHSITWTQHGIVYADYEMIGAYDRLTDTDEKQEMFVQIFLEQEKTSPKQKQRRTQVRSR